MSPYTAAPVLLGLAQLDPTVGDVPANADAIIAAARRLADAGAELVLTPEMSILGYPPRDLLLRADVVDACRRGLERIAAASPVPVLVGTPRNAPGGLRGRRNAVALCDEADVSFVCDKRLLPGYDVFDEDRWFDPGEGPATIEVGGRRFGVLICEDLWRGDDVTGSGATYDRDPLGELAGACAILSLSASPFVRGKHERHAALLHAAAGRLGVPVASVNAVGANDDLVFDGRSMVATAGGIVRTLDAFAVDETVIALDDAASAPARTPAPVERRGPWAGPTVGAGFEPETFAALVRGVADYADRTGLGGACLGLSGGIDSAVVAAVAVRALGPERVRGVMLPSCYSSAGSIDDAIDLARRLGMAAPERVSIEALHDGARDAIEPMLGGAREGVTDENVQARLRGLLLMATSNATGSMLLSTSNKSELAVGYSTLYGDMCGALAPIGDLWKGEVYALARWMNEHPAEAGFDGPPIPPASIDKPPSAELRPDQKDTDTLPDYPVLDGILARLVDHDEDAKAAAAATGADPATCERIAGMLDRAEHKRYQATIVLKTNPRTFGRGRRMPVVMRDRHAAESGAPAASPAAAARPTSE